MSSAPVERKWRVLPEPARPGSVVTTSPGHCDKHGAFESGYYSYWERSDGAKMFERGPICPTCEKEREERIAREEAERKEKLRGMILTRRRTVAGREPRFEECTFDSYRPQNPEQEKIVAWLKSWAADCANEEKCKAAHRSSIVLCGPVGTGKTHLAHAIVSCLIAEMPMDLKEGANYRDDVFSVIYRNTSRVLRAIKASWSKSNFGLDDQEDGLSETRILDRLCTADILILDEVGVQFGSDFERNYLFEIVDKRYSAMLPTVVISNLDMKGLEICLGQRAMSRLCESPSRVFALTGMDYRKKVNR